MPLDHWFRNELRAMTADVLLDSRAISRGYFRTATVRRMIDEHVRSERSWHEQLWNLLMLELWHRMFIDDRPARTRVADRSPSEANVLARVV